MKMATRAPLAPVTTFSGAHLDPPPKRLLPLVVSEAHYTSARAHGHPSHLPGHL